MRCGKCNSYIPDLPNITACPECGLPIEEARKYHEEALLKKKLAEEKTIAEQRRNQRSFSYPEAIFYSFFSRYFYRDVLRRWNGTGILYAAFLSALWMIPVGAWLQSDFDKDFEKAWVPIIKQVPHLTVENGSLRYEGKDPHVIKNSNDQIAFLFTRNLEPIDFNNIPAFFVVTPNRIAMKEAQGSSKIVDLPTHINFTITSKSAEYWSTQIMRWLIFMVYPFVWSVTLMMVLLFVLFYAVVGKILSLIFRIPTDFQNIYRMTVVAVTPCVVVSPASFLWDKLDKVVDPLMIVAPIFFTALGFWHNREPRPKKDAS